MESLLLLVLASSYYFCGRNRSEIQRFRNVNLLFIILDKYVINIEFWIYCLTSSSSVDTKDASSPRCKEPIGSQYEQSRRESHYKSERGNAKLVRDGRGVVM